MTSVELKELLNQSKDVLILDIREPHEIAICQFDDALHIPMMQISYSFDQIPRDKPVVVACHLGIQSAMTVNYLIKNGFDNIHDLLGGIDHWDKTVDPQMQQY